jgi:hypothetical protein
MSLFYRQLDPGIHGRSAGWTRIKSGVTKDDELFSWLCRENMLFAMVPTGIPAAKGDRNDRNDDSRRLARGREPCAAADRAQEASASVAAAGANDPLTRPMAVESAKEWLAPLPPEKIFGTSYLVGFGGLSVALIDTGAGLVLIDGALAAGGARDPRQCSQAGVRPQRH